MDAAVRRRILGSNLMKTSDFKPKARNPQHLGAPRPTTRSSHPHIHPTTSARPLGI
jgi:hypothetical protein